MQRYGSVLGLKADKIERYKELHAAVWPDVLKMIKACNIENYSIYLRKLPDGKLHGLPCRSSFAWQIDGVPKRSRQRLDSTHVRGPR